MLKIFKSTSSLTSFLKYCKDIANLLFWELWEFLIIPIKNHSVNLWQHSWLSASKKSTSSVTPFWRYCKEIANLLFWVIWACLKWWTFDVYLQTKNQLRILHIFLEILQKYCNLVISCTWTCPAMHTQSDTIKL